MPGINLRAVIFAAALSSGAVACAGAEPPVAHATKVTPGIVFSAKASLTSQSALGITRWHSTVGHGANGTLAIDGQDARGRVTFLATAYVNRQTKTVHVVSHLPAKGELVFDLTDRTVVSNTLPGVSAPYAKAMLEDYALAHPLHGSKAYAATGLGDVAGGAVRVVGGALIFAGGFITQNADLQKKGADLFEKGTEQIATGVEKLVDGAAGKPTEPAKAAVAQVDETVASADPTTPPADPPAAGAADPSEGTAEPSAGGADATGDAPATEPGGAPAEPSEPTADVPSTLPDTNTGGNLDDVGGDGAATGTASADPSGSTDPSGTDTGGTETAGADTGGADTGGADTGGADTGGGSEFAVGKCRQVARSKTSGVRACVHY
jgi:hypothetical protein